MIHDHKQACYDAINASNEANESIAFIEFMLAAIKASLIEAINVSDVMSDAAIGKSELRWKKIETFLQPHDYVMNADVRGLCGVSLSQQIGFWRDARPTKSSKSVVQVVIGDTERRSEFSFVLGTHYSNNRQLVHCNRIDLH